MSTIDPLKKHSSKRQRHDQGVCSQHCELLIQSDGQIYVHNLTTQMADILSALNPSDDEMRARAEQLKQIQSIP